LRKLEERSRILEALKGRNISTRGSALGLNEHAIKIAPRSEVIQGGAIAWGKRNKTEVPGMRFRIKFGMTDNNAALETRTEKKPFSLSFLPFPLGGKSRREWGSLSFSTIKTNNSICQWTDVEYKNIYLN